MFLYIIDNFSNRLFLVYRPTEVGETEMAKVLAKENYGDKEAIVRLDMNHSAVSQLIGSPPSYNSHYDGGLLTEEVR